MIDYKDYRKNASEHDLCSEFIKIWDSCKSKKQLMDMALGAKGVDFLCASIAEGWGISPESLAYDFEPFMNGRYVRDIDGYTSKMYCRFMGKVIADTTIVTLIDSEVKLEVPKSSICEVYCAGDCSIDVKGDGEVVFICYGEESSIGINGSCSNMKRINKKERDKYEL